MPSRRVMILAPVAILLLLAAAAAAAQSQDPNQPQIGLVIKGTAIRRIPLVLLPFSGPASADREARSAADLVREVVDADLTYSGVFNVLPPALYSSISRTVDRIPFRDYAAIGADGVVVGDVGRRDAEIVVEGMLFDSRSEGLIAGKRYRGGPALARDIGHRIADDIMVAYTGRPGVSLTRIVFVGRTRAGAKEIFVMDYDGQDLNQITRNGSINVSPTWSPGGKKLAFVSYAQGNPRLFIYSGDDGRLTDVSPRGSELCVAPDWSPDGRYVAFSSSEDGNSEIFVLDLQTGKSRQITFTRGADTAPAWSPSGREIAFTSDRSGSPQIYLMDVEGANVRRLTTGGSYSESAAWSPDGERLAYASRIDGRFEILVHDVVTGNLGRLTQNAGNNENPRWSPNGRHIVFSSNRTGSYQLYTMDIDGNRQERIRTGMESTMPEWSK